MVVLYSVYLTYAETEDVGTRVEQSLASADPRHAAVAFRLGSGASGAVAGQPVHEYLNILTENLGILPLPTPGSNHDPIMIVRGGEPTEADSPPQSRPPKPEVNRPKVR